MNDRWLRCRAPRADPRVRVVCFPHAGGTAGPYAAWGAALDGRTELSAVQYPGREERIEEPPPHDLDALLSGVCRALLPLAGRPLVLFGHSLGAVVAYETARRLTRQGAPPARLVVSGRRAPCVPVTGDLHTRSDDALVAELARLGATSAELLAEPAFRTVYLPAVRADFALAETYRYAPAGPLPCPVTAVIGAADTEVDHDQASRWAAHTTGAFTLRTVPGGHFWFVPDDTGVLHLLRTAAHEASRPVPSESETPA